VLFVSPAVPCSTAAAGEPASAPRRGFPGLAVISPAGFFLSIRP
jgi:hypothetical protein